MDTIIPITIGLIAGGLVGYLLGVTSTNDQLYRSQQERGDHWFEQYRQACEEYQRLVREREELE